MNSLDLGRLTAYGGGASVGVSSAAQQAASTDVSDSVSLLNYPLPMPQLEITLGDIITTGGFLVVLARFIWDVRRDRRDQQQQELNQ